MQPISIYIHIPWCLRKCPYCDFNSHEQKSELPEQTYIDQLIKDFDRSQSLLEQRPIQSIFIGGGTPSLFHPKAIKRILDHIIDHHPCLPSLEITMEANPGTTEHYDFAELKHAGVNRLSLGVQSFHPAMLKALGRIHSHDEAHLAIKKAQQGGFDNINIDLMFGLPQQSEQDALEDLRLAIAHVPSHISWYQLTIEPHTAFYYRKPKLPNQDAIWTIQQKGQNLLAEAGYPWYEISAYSAQKSCAHNLNYWQFGDYLGIGAGAHSKLSCSKSGIITRSWRQKHPKAYLKADNTIAGTKQLNPSELPLEFLMNRLRLRAPLNRKEYECKIDSSWEDLLAIIKHHDIHQWVSIDEHALALRTHAYLDEILTWFLPENTNPSE